MSPLNFRMKAVILLMALLLVSGCLQPAPQNMTENETPPFKTPPMHFNRSPLPQPPQVPPAPPPPPVNQTPANQTPPTEPEPEPPAGWHFGPHILVLDDVSVIPNSDEPCGIFSIRDASDDTVLDKKIICPGESAYWEGYRIFVVKVAAGYSGGENWADVRIYG